MNVCITAVAASQTVRRAAERTYILRSTQSKNTDRRQPTVNTGVQELTGGIGNSPINNKGGAQLTSIHRKLPLYDAAAVDGFNDRLPFSDVNAGLLITTISCEQCILWSMCPRTARMRNACGCVVLTLG